jgi:hypothetical protein
MDITEVEGFIDYFTDHFKPIHNNELYGICTEGEYVFIKTMTGIMLYNRIVFEIKRQTKKRWWWYSKEASP